MGTSIRTHSNVVDVTPVLTTGAHTDGDYMATVELPNALLDAGHTGILQSISVIDNDEQALGIDFLIFGDEPTVASAKNAAFDMTDANIKLAKFLGKVSMVSGDYLTTTSNSIATVRNIGLVLEGIKNATARENTKSIWVVLVARGASTYAADGLTCYFGVLQD